MKCLTNLLSLACFIVCAGASLLQAQTTVAFQGGEVGDTWTFQAITNAGGAVPPGIVAVNARTGSNAIRVGGGNTACTGGINCITGGANSATGCAMHGNTLQFDPINIACLPNVQLTVHTRSQGFLCSGAGFDSGENVVFEYRLDGGAWTADQTMLGFNNYNWDYTDPMIGGTLPTVPNPWVYNVPPGITTIEFRVRSNFNRSDEVFYVDDVRLTTSSTAYAFPGTPGLWNGAVDDNWFNPCNWSDRQVPTPVTNVTFPTGSNNDIVIQGGQNCQCNNLTCSGGAGRMIRAAADPTKMLTVFGNLTNNTTAGSTVLNFSDGLPGTPDGTLNLHGNWTNNSSANDFVEGESTVNFLGTANQTITLSTIEPFESFFNFTVMKAGGDVVLAKSVQIGGVLSLLNGKVTTGANAVGVANFLPAAVSGHSPASYVNGNLVRAIQTGPGTRTYDYPLGTAANYELASFTFTNPSGFTAIGGFFNPVIGGAAPNISEGGFLYDQILNAGVWNLAPDLPFVGTYDVTLVERGYTNGGAASYIDVKRTNAAAPWTNPGSHVSFSEVAGVVTCTRSGLNAFSDFAIALSNTPLAANDVFLQATPLGGSVVGIDWSWDSDAQAGKFDLQRVHEGQTTLIGQWEPGAGNQITTQDANAPLGLLRYELLHTDLNGMQSLAASDEVWNDGSADAAPMLWPNPNDGVVHLQLGGSENWQLELLRADGALVLQHSGAANEVQGRFENAVQTLAAGVYFMKCTQAGKVYHIKMVRR